MNEFANDVHAGLSRPGQKQLPCKYFYDDVGSALFEVITFIPDYGLTKADVRLLEKHAKQLNEFAVNPSVVAEFGSGSGVKARLILEALSRSAPIAYCPIDLSASSLHRCSQELADIESVRVRPLQESFFDGLRQAVALRKPGTSILVLFLGSSIGNFGPSEADEFCRKVRAELFPGDVFLLSADIEKEVSRMIAAYDDPLGVTASFNLNILARINRELGADFDLRQFRHEARYNREHHRVEMHLVSQIDQQVNMGNGVVTFRKGETIWTESCYKFERAGIRRLGESTGFKCEAQWVDDIWTFAQTVFRAI